MFLSTFPSSSPATTPLLVINDTHPLLTAYLSTPLRKYIDVLILWFRNQGPLKRKTWPTIPAPLNTF